jgi:hypothetical protein
MDPSVLRQLVTVEPANSSMAAPAAPARAILPQSDKPIELDQFRRPAITRTSTHGTTNPEDLENSRPTTPVGGREGDGTEIIQSTWNPYMNRFRVLSACLLNFGNGLNDSAPGALIPYMEK